MADIRKRYIACMVLAGVGDAMGYKCGTWEFCTAGRMIHEEMKALGGVEKLEIKCESDLILYSLGLTL